MRNRIVLIVSLLVLTAGCSTERVARRPAASAQVAPTVSLTAEQIAVLAACCGEFGHPIHGPGWPGGGTDFVFRDEYVLEHWPLEKIPVWVWQPPRSESTCYVRAH